MRIAKIKPPLTISFVAGSSNSGKTTLIEKVVKILKAGGYRVAVIKHASKGFELDRPGKDSWRFQQAGADDVVVWGPGTTAVIHKTEREPTSDELEMLVDADIVIHEGFRKAMKNRIEVFREGVSGQKPLCMDDPDYIALVSDKLFDAPVPYWNLNDAEGVADFIIKKIAAR